MDKHLDNLIMAKHLDNLPSHLVQPTASSHTLSYKNSFTDERILHSCTISNKVLSTSPKTATVNANTLAAPPRIS